MADDLKLTERDYVRFADGKGNNSSEWNKKDGNFFLCPTLVTRRKTFFSSALTVITRHMRRLPTTSKHMFYIGLSEVVPSPPPKEKRRGGGYGYT